jgi:hypothetical protein
MILRVRLPRGRPIRRAAGKNRHLALAFGGLMMPLALMAYVLGFWRLASDMGIASESGITGVLSHWQVWIPAGALLQFAGTSLTRYGRGGDLNIPKLLVFSMREQPVSMQEQPVPMRERTLRESKEPEERKVRS